MIPTGNKRRPKKNGTDETQAGTDYMALCKKSAADAPKTQEKITFLEKELEEVRSQLQEQRETFRKISEICAAAPAAPARQRHNRSCCSTVSLLMEGPACTGKAYRIRIFCPE